MNNKRVGRRTIAFSHPPAVLSCANIGGKIEGEGPLASAFDELTEDSFYGEKTWEKAESAMQKSVLARALGRANLREENLDYILAGDLLNQCIGSTFALRESGIPLFGIYGACSNMGEGLALASALIDGGFADRAAALTSSHYCTAERQYRMPMPYGNQRTPTAQWTATAAGCVILGTEGSGPRITHATCGRIVDKGVTDASNMGAAMAPVDVKLAPYPEETRQYKIQLFSTKYDCFHGGDMVFRTKKKYLQWHQKSRQASVAVCRLLQYKVLFTRLYIGTVSDFGFSPIGKIPFIFGLLLLIFC